MEKIGGGKKCEEKIEAGVLCVPSSMLLPEQMGWTFHRVCMKEASTWMLPLEMDKCCGKEGKITHGFYLFAYINTRHSAWAYLSEDVKMFLL